MTRSWGRAVADRAAWRSSVDARRAVGLRYGWDSAEYAQALDRSLELQRVASKRGA